MDQPDDPAHVGRFALPARQQGLLHVQIVRRRANLFAEIGKDGVLEQRFWAHRAAEQGVEPVAHQRGEQRVTP